MTTAQFHRRDELRALVREALFKAECQLDGYRPLNRHLPIIGIFCGMMVTLCGLWGMASGKGYIAQGMVDLTVLCECIAFFAVVGTTAMVIHHALRVSEKVDVCEKCLAGLRELDAGLADPRMETLPAVEAYQNIQMNLASVTGVPVLRRTYEATPPAKPSKLAPISVLISGGLLIHIELGELPERLKAHEKHPYWHLAVPVLICVMSLCSLLNVPKRITWLVGLLLFLAFTLQFVFMR